MRACLVLLLLLPSVASAHKMDPLLLNIEAQDNGYWVEWNLPQELVQSPTPPKPVFPAHCVSESASPCVTAPDRRCYNYLLKCEPFSLAGHTIQIEGMEVLTNSVIVELLHGRRWTTILSEDENTVELPSTTEAGAMPVLSNYYALGFEHIMGGLDHLLFVLGLLLLVVGTRRLVVTITAFTVGHSITLGASVLGWVSAPGTVIELVIALSVLLLAVELTHERNTLTRRFPWVVAGVFGLLHGFGFAGALADIGLGESHIPLALLGFNLGVEIGQLVFIGAILMIAQIRFLDLRDYPRMASYFIGVPAAAWSMERLMAWGTVF